MLDGIRGTALPVAPPPPLPPPPPPPPVETPTRGGYQMEPAYHPQIAPPQSPSTPLPADNASWAADFSGQDSHPLDLDMMQLSNAVYDPSVTQVGNWSRVSDADLQAAGIDPASLEDPTTGFRAGIYTDNQGHYVLAYSGSNGNNDWINTNIPQGVGAQTEQYDQAVALAQQVANSKFGADGNLVLTGHSLGGGLAGIASLVTGVPAATYDASGVHDDTMRQFGLDPATAKAAAENGLIRRYNVEGDPLTAAQQDTPGLSSIMPDAPGHEITLESPIEKPKWDWWHPIESAKEQAAYTADMHRQQTMIDALSQQRPWDN